MLAAENTISMHLVYMYLFELESCFLFFSGYIPSSGISRLLVELIVIFSFLK